MRIRKLRCSFCRKTEDQISKLVAGPRLIVGFRLHICNECLAVANSIMQGNPRPTPAASRSLLQQKEITA
jgi:ATP-dependent protease Clp ATPase subunit